MYCGSCSYMCHHGSWIIIDHGSSSMILQICFAITLVTVRSHTSLLNLSGMSYTAQDHWLSRLEFLYCPLVWQGIGKLMITHIFAFIIVSDIDECVTTNGGCSDTCTNNAGSFVCSCLTGYELDTDDLTCIGRFTLQTSLNKLLNGDFYPQ